MGSLHTLSGATEPLPGDSRQYHGRDDEQEWQQPITPDGKQIYEPANDPKEAESENY
jgi:hypothetical protein